MAVYFLNEQDNSIDMITTAQEMVDILKEVTKLPLDNMFHRAVRKIRKLENKRIFEARNISKKKFEKNYPLTEAEIFLQSDKSINIIRIDPETKYKSTYGIR